MQKLEALITAAILTATVYFAAPMQSRQVKQPPQSSSTTVAEEVNRNADELIAKIWLIARNSDR
ncbi:MAG: hypothetical protein SAL07_09705 [Oscillatoria sp. PMC 1051.18]|uniref:hypothetical protein n=1 Tax=Oscillatoria salina TaxID=331517 RepID=UPI0013B7D063|nr:hypothetical protein [Oscillatoria salina]MBZ8182733.1 hypothetical protein [Oscillatoria salina IIICB1]MEC5030177.1 hypothetical protein [Oscillatoria sp. PMC 1051.18]NET90960.1 hypothetical protein [Kamptonema sp. SIO1D9]